MAGFQLGSSFFLTQSLIRIVENKRCGWVFNVTDLCRPVAVLQMSQLWVGRVHHKMDSSVSVIVGQRMKQQDHDTCEWVLLRPGQKAHIQSPSVTIIIII